MPNLRMAKKGTHFNEGAVQISWPSNWPESTVVSVPKSKITLRLAALIANGRIKETKRKATEDPADDVRSYKLMTGKEAKEHMAIPAGPVTRRVYSPKDGGIVEVEIQRPRPRNEPEPETDLVGDEEEDDELTEDEEAEAKQAAKEAKAAAKAEREAKAAEAADEAAKEAEAAEKAAEAAKGDQPAEDAEEDAGTPARDMTPAKDVPEEEQEESGVPVDPDAGREDPESHAESVAPAEASAPSKSKA